MLIPFWLLSPDSLNLNGLNEFAEGERLNDLNPPASSGMTIIGKGMLTWQGPAIQ
jgi:hypothetical protein